MYPFWRYIIGATESDPAVGVPLMTAYIAWTHTFATRVSFSMGSEDMGE
jgi:hypothetical protein